MPLPLPSRLTVTKAPCRYHFPANNVTSGRAGSVAGGAVAVVGGAACVVVGGAATVVAERAAVDVVVAGPAAWCFAALHALAPNANAINPAISRPHDFLHPIG